LEATATPPQEQPGQETQGSTGYAFERGGRSENSLNSGLATDGDPTTVWTTEFETAPESAFVWYDVGGRKSIGEIRWLITEAVPGVTLTIEVSTNRRRWEEVATITEFTPGEWQSADGEGEEARYVRFTFTNPERAPVIGYLAEVEVHP
jgi:hypothetical protein